MRLGTLLGLSALAVAAVASGFDTAQDTASQDRSLPEDAQASELIDPPRIRSLPGYSSHYVRAPVFGGRIYTVEVGPATGPPVVLVHGISKVGAADWYEVLPELAERYRVLAFDLPGFGRSSQTAGVISPRELKDGTFSDLPSTSGMTLGTAIRSASAAWNGIRIRIRRLSARSAPSCNERLPRGLDRDGGSLRNPR